MQRFLREIRNESDEYRGGAVKVEAQSQELAKQFRELKSNVNAKLLAANKPLSPRAVRHSLTPRPIKTANSSRQPYYSPQVKSRNKRSGSFATQYQQRIDDYQEDVDTAGERKTNSRPNTPNNGKIVFTFPDKLSDI